MVLNGTRARGLTDDPDQVLRAPVRWLPVAAAMFVAAVGVLFAVGGAFAPLDAGEQGDWFPVVFGVQLAALAGAMVASVWPVGPASRPFPAPALVSDGVALPMRQAPRVAGLVGLLVVASVGVTLAVVADGTAMAVLGVVIAVGVVALGVWLWRAGGRGAGAIVLNPTSVRLPAGTTPRITIAWTDLVEVAVTGGWKPHLVVTYQGPGLSASRLGGQAWPPSALVAVLDHYRTHPDARAQLDRVDALDQFRN